MHFSSPCTLPPLEIHWHQYCASNLDEFRFSWLYWTVVRREKMKEELWQIIIFTNFAYFVFILCKKFCYGALSFNKVLKHFSNTLLSYQVKIAKSQLNYQRFGKILMSFSVTVSMDTEWVLGILISIWISNLWADQLLNAPF